MNGIKFNPVGLIDRAALAHLQSKKLLPGFSHWDVWLDMHAQAFTVAKMMDADLLAEVRAALSDALADGTDWRTFKQRLKPYLMSRGWWGQQVLIDPLDEEPKLVQLGSTRRLKTIFQTNMSTAYAAGQWQRVQSDKAVLPYLRYNPSSADNQRDKHKSFYGLILPVEHPVWQQIFPPNGYGCRCSVSQLTRKQAEREGISAEPEIEYVEAVNPRTGEVVRVPRSVDPSFAHNHARKTEYLLEVAREKHGEAFAQELKDAVGRHVQQRLERPNFAGVVPNLTVLSDGGIADAQTLVYAHAGRGQQVGFTPVGKPVSFETVHIGGQDYWFEYTANGVKVNTINRRRLLNHKRTEITALAEKICSGSDLDFLGKHREAIHNARFGDADLADKLAAHIYTTNGGYRRVNPFLIEHKGDLSRMDNDAVQLTRALDRFLQVAPKYRGITVRRIRIDSIPDPDAFLDAHRTGSLIRYSNFTSTGKPGGSYNQHLFDIEITIHGRSGVDISRLSRFSDEWEVLMPRTAVYRVIAYSRKDDVHRIMLEEIDGKAHNGETIMQLSMG